MSGSAEEISLHGIASIERITGISKDTLRIWERRYGFPSPYRDECGERLYPDAQVKRLILLKRLLDAGFRPGRIVAATPDELEKLLAESHARRLKQAGSSTLAVPELASYISLLRTHEVELLRQRLAQAIIRMGLAACIKDLIAPLTTAVGEAWMHGELQVFEEHIYSESLQQVLRPAIHGVQRATPDGGPRVLLTTLPGEQHGLGLLMVEALLTLEGCRCLSLGVQTPPGDIVQAALVQKTDIVGLSFTGRLSAAALLDELRSLRARLPAEIALWAGGRAAALRRCPPGVRPMRELADLAPALAEWTCRSRLPLPA